jgi:hypothetical protein
MVGGAVGPGLSQGRQRRLEVEGFDLAHQGACALRQDGSELGLMLSQGLFDGKVPLDQELFDPVEERSCGIGIYRGGAGRGLGRDGGARTDGVDQWRELPIEPVDELRNRGTR